MTETVGMSKLLDIYEEACERDMTVCTSRENDTMYVRRSILPGIFALCVYRVHDCGVGLTTYPGVTVPDDDVPVVLRAMARINCGMIRGSFGIDEDNDVYFENFLPSSGEVDYDLFLREVALGPKMVITHMGDIVGCISDEGSVTVSGKDGERYLINDDKEMGR